MSRIISRCRHSPRISGAKTGTRCHAGSRAMLILETLGGVAIRGYRAPSFSINRMNWWAVEELEIAGYVYSSSIYPVRHDHYGMPDAPQNPHHPKKKTGILE